MATGAMHFNPVTRRFEVGPPTQVCASLLRHSLHPSTHRWIMRVEAADEVTLELTRAR